MDGEATEPRPKFTRGDKAATRVRIQSRSRSNGRFVRGDHPDAEHERRYVHIAPQLKPHSKKLSPKRVDGRTIEGALMRRVRRELVAHCGGRPSATQKTLIERAAWLSLRIELLDRKLADGQAFGPYESNVYLAWVGALSRIMSRLGIEPKRHTTRKSLKEYVAETEVSA